jgi:hypothetical protein
MAQRCRALLKSVFVQESFPCPGHIHPYNHSLRMNRRSRLVAIKDLGDVVGLIIIRKNLHPLDPPPHWPGIKMQSSHACKQFVMIVWREKVLCIVRTQTGTGLDLEHFIYYSLRNSYYFPGHSTPVIRLKVFNRGQKAWRSRDTPLSRILRRGGVFRWPTRSRNKHLD